MAILILVAGYFFNKKTRNTYILKDTSEINAHKNADFNVPSESEGDETASIAES